MVALVVVLSCGDDSDGAGFGATNCCGCVFESGEIAKCPASKGCPGKYGTCDAYCQDAISYSSDGVVLVVSLAAENDADCVRRLEQAGVERKR